MQRRENRLRSLLLAGFIVRFSMATPSMLLREGAARPSEGGAVYFRHSSPGIVRRMNSSKSGTVKAVSPWFGL